MIGIFGKVLLRGLGLKFTRLNTKLKTEFTKIREDFDEHLQAINENTNEIAANYEYICEIEKRLDRLAERVDKIQMLLETDNYSLPRPQKYDVQKLNRKEQEVFLVIYTLEEEKGTITYRDVAERLGISEHLAGQYVTALIEKGVPVIKRYIKSTPFLKLDPVFKTLQTKENILQLSLEEFF